MDMPAVSLCLMLGTCRIEYRSLAFLCVLSVVMPDLTIVGGPIKDSRWFLPILMGLNAFYSAKICWRVGLISVWFDFLAVELIDFSNIFCSGAGVPN